MYEPKQANLSKWIYSSSYVRNLNLGCITTTNHNWSKEKLLCIVLYCLPDTRKGGGGGGEFVMYWVIISWGQAGCKSSKFDKGNLVTKQGLLFLTGSNILSQSKLTCQNESIFWAKLGCITKFDKFSDNFVHYYHSLHCIVYLIQE